MRRLVVVAVAVAALASSASPSLADHRPCDARSARPSGLTLCRVERDAEHLAAWVGWRVRHFAYLGTLR